MSILQLKLKKLYKKRSRKKSHTCIHSILQVLGTRLWFFRPQVLVYVSRHSSEEDLKNVFRYIELLNLKGFQVSLWIEKE